MDRISVINTIQSKGRTKGGLKITQTMGFFFRKKEGKGGLYKKKSIYQTIKKSLGVSELYLYSEKMASNTRGLKNEK